MTETGPETAEQRLVRTQAAQLDMLRLAEQMAGIGHWRLDLASGRATWSDVVYRIHGVSPGAFDPNLDGALDFYHPDDRAIVTGCLAGTTETGKPYEFRARLRRADGEERIVLSRGMREMGEDGKAAALFGLFQDVTEETLAAQRMAESERRYRLLADRATDIIMCHAPDGTLTYASPSLEPVSGRRPEEVLGRPSMEMIHPDDHGPIIEAYLGALKDRSIERLTPLRYRSVKTGDGVRWFESRVTVIREDDGRVREFHDVSRDITQTKALEDQLTEARDRAEAGARAKSEFLANMSHELRTPLTSVIGFAGLLQSSLTLAEDERRYADRIGTASEALLGVINDILDYSKLEAEAVELEPQPFDPAALVRDAADLVEGQCLMKGLGLAVELDEGLPAALMGDGGRLRQVTLNFLSNAAKFTARGGITVEAGMTDGRLRVAVTDTGIGVSADKIDQLFDRFTQADASTTRVYGGTGLGLAISRRLIEMMGGEIGADSRPGEGATFWFEVPLARAEAMVPAAPLEAGEGPGDVRLLMADDAPANRELVTAMLGALGLELDTVEDGAQAVEAARSGGYDLILMDVHMPVMDGLAATAAIRALPGAVAATPVVALTANVGPEQVERCLAAGMNAHVGKPIQLAELVRVMNACLDASARTRRAA